MFFKPPLSALSKSDVSDVEMDRKEAVLTIADV